MILPVLHWRAKAKEPDSSETQNGALCDKGFREGMALIRFTEPFIIIWPLNQPISWNQFFKWQQTAVLTPKETHVSFILLWKKQKNLLLIIDRQPW